MESKMRTVEMPKKKTVVVASGVFDLVHLGHILFLQKAREAGGKNAELVVIVARDSTVEKMKGKAPILPEDERRAIVESLKPVDKAILGYEELDIGGVIKHLKPDIIALGYDQRGIMKKVQEAVKSGGFDIKVIKIKKFGRKDLNSSSKIKRKIIENMK
jgi:FAD synthetase